MFSEENFFNNLVDIIKKGVSNDITYLTWFDKLKFKEIKNKTAYFSVPIDYMKETIEKRYNALFKEAVAEASQGELINYVIFIESQKSSSFLENFNTIDYESCLNKRYTFENFVIGSSNSFAHAAAVAFAQNPAGSYNPLFLYGGVGLGKTHLMHAIGNRITQTFLDKKVLYTTSETFKNEFIQSIKTGKNNDFREKFRNIDVLMIDDIQFIGGKERSQEEFFHTFNHLYQNNKQIIISSDRPPKEISTLEDRLRTRFEAGLMCDINAPDFETRIAILMRKKEQEHIDIDDDIVELIAKKITSNIRELEGILIRIMAITKLSDEKVTKDMAEDIIKVIIKDKKKAKPEIESVIFETANYFNLEPSLLKSKSKKKEIALARQIAMYIARNMLEMSLPKIGEEFGGRDHSTVMHSISKIEEEKKYDQNIQNVIEEVTSAVIN